MRENDDDRIVETPTQARAGVTGHNVRIMLMASLISAIVLLIAIAALSLH